MDEHSKVIPMRPIRDVLRDFESMVDAEEDAPDDGRCRRCNGTGTELIVDEQTKITSARRCTH